MTATVVAMAPGAELEAGGRDGLGQSTGTTRRLGRELSANGLGAASGNGAMGLTAGTPSFRSSWQLVLNASGASSSGTRGIAREDASESVAADTLDSVSGGHAAFSGRASVTVPVTSSRLESTNATARQDLSAAGAASEKAVGAQAIRPAWKAAQNSGAQATSNRDAEATETGRAGAANRSHASTAAQAANQENRPQAAAANPQTMALAVEAPVQLPVPAQIAERAQTTGTISATESSAESSQWSSAQSSTAARWPGATETVRPAAATLSKGVYGSGTGTGMQAQTASAGAASTLHSAAPNETARETAASSPDDADEPAARQPLNALPASEPGSAELQHEASMPQPSAGNEGASQQTLSASTAGNLDRFISGEGIAPSVAPLAAVSDAAQASAGTMRNAPQQLGDRGLPHAASRNATEHAAGATLAAAAQPGGMDAAASSAMRVSGVSPISTASTLEHAQTATAASAPASTQDTFSALDAGSSLGAPSWTHVGSQHAEAGFQDPSLGWVGVRADLSAGGIHATLVPSSADAAQALSGHLAGLSSHLVEQQSSVASLALTSPGESGAENGMGQHLQQDAEGDSQRNASEQSPMRAQATTAEALTASVSEAAGSSSRQDPLTYAGDSRGTHISVMA